MVFGGTLFGTRYWDTVVGDGIWGVSKFFATLPPLKGIGHSQYYNSILSDVDC